MGSTLPRVVGAFLALAACAGSASAQILTQDEALELAFPGAVVERETAYLDDARLAEARERAGAGVEVETGVVTHYVATRAGEFVGVAYFDAHRVRTLPEVLMIVVGPDGEISRVETVAFREPPEYRAPDRWLDLAVGIGGGEGSVGRVGNLPNIGGATLTADAVKGALRRTLALHAVIAPFEAGGAGR